MQEAAASDKGDSYSKCEEGKGCRMRGVFCKKEFNKIVPYRAVLDTMK